MSTRMIRSVVVLGLIAGALAVSARAEADYTSALTGSAATMTGNADPDRLEIDASLGNLRHSRFAAGDAGFVSAQDFNTTAATEQTVPNNGSSSVTINAGDGDDVVVIGSETIPASGILAPVTVDLGNTGGIDTLVINDAGSATDVPAAEVTSNSIFGFGGTVTYSGVEVLIVIAGSGNDVIEVGPGVPSATIVQASGGNDRVAPFDGVVVAANGGAGNDTLDFGEWFTPVTYAPPTTVALRSGPAIIFSPSGPSFPFMSGSQEVPPATSDASGIARLEINLTTRAFNFDAAVEGMTRAQLSDSHIHTGAIGRDGGIVVPLGSGTASWVDDNQPALGGAVIVRAIDGGAFPAATLADLLAGNTYVNLHTAAFPGGEIRGQLLLEPGTKIGFENVFGGFSDDVITGDAGANVLVGGPGGDRLSGSAGPDVIRGGEGDDVLIGGRGAKDVLLGQADRDKLKARDGKPDKKINCGSGNDKPASFDPGIDPPPRSC